MKRYLRIFILVVIIFSFPCFAYPLGRVYEKKEIYQSQAPNFSLYDLKYKKTYLSDYMGRNVILFFWTTRCPYCLQDLIKLERRYLGLRPKGIEILAIDVGEDRKIVSDFLKRYNISYTVLLDSDDEVAMLYKLRGVPTYVIIGADGKLIFKGHYLPEDILEDLR